MKTSSLPPLMGAADSYHQVRFVYDKRRTLVWRAIARYLQQWVRADEGLLELGAGYGEFSSEIQAAAKWSLDLSRALVKHWASSVMPLIQPATDPWPLSSGSLGTVFASNFFEHLTLEEGTTVLAEALRVLRPGGRLIVIQPNFRLEPRRYFDDYTHRTIFTDSGFSDFVKANGWRVVHSEPRFVPFSMKSRLPTAEWLVRLYLALPVRPLAGQFLLVAEKPGISRPDLKITA
jgi:SAM-dependent methyltransferase